MSHHQPSSLHHGLPLVIDPESSPGQVMAVVELLEDLRERIWRHDETVLLDRFQNDRVSPDISRVRSRRWCLHAKRVVWGYLGRSGAGSEPNGGIWADFPQPPK